jgi:hypothetical protein
MSTDETPGTGARRSADLPGRDPGSALSGLIDVLDRADGVAAGTRPQRSAGARPAAVRTAAVRTQAARAGSLRGVPLRPVQPAPAARPALPARAPAAVLGPPVTAAARRAPTGRLRALVRRLALWGAGPNGEYLAWSSAPPARRVDPPVLLREMPSTPTVRTPRPPARRPGPPRARVARPAATVAPLPPHPPAVSSPRPPAVSSPHPPAAPPPRPAAGPVPGRPARPAPTATGWPRVQPLPAGRVVPRSFPPGSPPAPIGRTSTPPGSAARRPARREPAAARARGDPVCCPVRGSPR